MVLKDLCLVQGLLCQLTTQNYFSGSTFYCQNASSIIAALESAARVPTEPQCFFKTLYFYGLSGEEGWLSLTFKPGKRFYLFKRFFFLRWQFSSSGLWYLQILSAGMNVQFQQFDHWAGKSNCPDGWLWVSLHETCIYQVKCSNFLIRVHFV